MLLRDSFNCMNEPSNRIELLLANNGDCHNLVPFSISHKIDVDLEPCFVQ